MQQQANRLRQTDENEPKTDNKWKRRSMDSDLAQGFQAQAAQHSNKPAERYAAHIPINVPSGRQSATSMESVQSVALDKASHKLDQMIDQARYKHQQHRTKFKEAIDYLDQIFEDLKKETVEPQNRPEKQKPDKFPVKITKTMTKGTTSPQRPQLVKSVSQDAGGNARIHPQKQLQPARFQQPISQAQKPVQHAVNAQFKGQREKPQKVESGDVEVTETIVLPSKNTSERLDYTRKWLQDDIKTWVDKPGNVNNQLRRVGSSGESDEEHSLGSCSAEVAFINAAKREKREKQPAKEKKTKTHPKPPPNMGAPIKPRPYRPNEQGAPGFVITDDQNPYNNIRPSTSDSVDRAASEFSHGSQNSHELKNCEKVLFSAEKVTFNSLQRSNSGAFVQFQRGSIQSLPDAMYGPTRTPLPYPPSNTSGYGSTSSQQYLHPPDPVHQMNALVAELELSNDPNFEKRRSFPIMPNDPQKSSPRQRPIANTTVKVQDPQSVPRLSVPQQHNYSGSMDRGMRRYEEKMAVQRPVDKSNVLAQKMGQKVVPNSEVVPKMVPNQKMVPKMAPKQKLEDAASLLDSVIGELHPLDAPKRPKATEHYAQNTVSQTTVPTWQQQMMAKKQQRIAQTGPGISGAPVMGQAYLQDPSVHQQVQYGTQHSTSIQHGTQVGVGLQHGTQVGTGLQHGTQVGTGLQHGTQHSTALQHGTQHAPSYTQQSNQYLQQPQHNPPHNSPRNQPVGVVHVHQHQHGQQAQLPNHFQIINDEKLNPSKVEAIHNIFDRKPIQRQGSREKVQRQRSSDQLQHQVQHRDLSQSGRDLDIVLHPPEPVYSEINEFRKDRSGSLKNPSRVQFDSRPSLPSTQPPNHRTYLSPTQKPVQRQGSLRTPHQYDKPQAQYEKPQAQYDRASLNSQNVDEEENFYDNIRTHCSDAHRQEDEHSVTSRRTIGAPYQTSRSPQPPMPKNAGRIGQLIRKLGGVPERPIVHQNSLHDNHGASVLSLNRVGQDGAQRPGMLMKSNSLSHEPWRIHAIEKDDSSMDQKTSGIGNRLKQTLFGSRKWHNN
ncbi:unnamed protein product [Bursaphelenchus okinawaensis]|uniref:Uncharacterized protein n=1 Tax=Bursaphelenchus okinawaensis TaxID=465554 RepID=A0A811JW96_9BILA|nr:unnamed protein product [Bursaphelenchus okinawaensis]CAG9086642.1 unnamed protein product [Bursaphelenchus okinawaensis]